MQKVLQKQRTLSRWRRTSMTALSLSATFLLASCASQPVAVDKQIPQELVKPELPAWRTWSTDFSTWLKDATQAGTDAPQEKTHSQKP